MSASLEGVVCAVTGASSGLGHAMAAGLAAEGARVVGFARRFGAPALEAIPEAGEIAEVKLDVRNEAEVRARFSELGELDVLITSAGHAEFSPVIEMEAESLRGMLDVYVVGAFLCAREALRLMQPRGRGHIVSIDSVATSQTFSASGGYTAAKSGQAGMMRVVAEEARAFGVRVSRVAPGATDTPLWDARPDFDRSAMMRPGDVAGLVVDVVRRPGISVEELLVIPPGGNL